MMATYPPLAQLCAAGACAAFAYQVVHAVRALRAAGLIR